MLETAQLTILSRSAMEAHVKLNISSIVAQILAAVGQRVYLTSASRLQLGRVLCGVGSHAAYSIFVLTKSGSNGSEPCTNGPVCMYVMESRE